MASVSANPSNVFKLFTANQPPVYQGPVMTAPGGSVSRDYRPSSTYRPLKSADSMLDASPFLPVRLASGEVFSANPLRLQAAASINLDGLSPEKAGLVTKARELLVSSATSKESYAAFLKLVGENPGLKGMGELLVVCANEPKALKLLQELSRKQELSPEVDRCILMAGCPTARGGEPILAALVRPSDQALRTLELEASKGKTEALEDLGALMSTGHYRQPADLRQAEGLIRGGLERNPAALDSTMSALRIGDKTTFSNPYRVASETEMQRQGLLGQLYASKKGKDDWAWLAQTLNQNSPRREYTQVMGENGQIKRTLVPNVARDLNRSFYRNFLEEASRKVAGDPKSPQRQQLVEICNQLLKNRDFAPEGESLVRALERLQPLSDSEKGSLACAKDRVKLFEAAKNPAQNLASPEQREAILNSAKHWIQSGFAAQEASDAIGALGKIPGALKLDQLKAMGSLAKTPEGIELLSGLAANSPGPEIRKFASEGLAGNLYHERVEPEGNKAALKILSEVGSPEAKAKAAEYVKPPSLGAYDKTAFDKKFSVKVEKLIKETLNGKHPELKTSVEAWLSAMRAQHLAETKYAGKGKVDEASIRARMTAASSGPLGRELARLQQETFKEIGGENTIHSLLSDEGQQRLNLMAPEKRQEFIKSQLEEVSKMSPTHAASLFEKLNQAEIHKHTPELLEKLAADPEKLEKLLHEVEHHYPDPKSEKPLHLAEATEKGMHAKHILDSLKHFKDIGVKPDGRMLTEHLEKHGHGKVAGLVKNLPALLAVANLGELAAGGFKAHGSELKATRDVLVLIERASELKALSAGLQSYKALGNGLKVGGKVAGVLGSVVSAHMEFNHMADQVGRGDAVGATAAGTAGAGYTTMAVGGVLVATGVGAPVGAVLIAAGACAAAAGTVLSFFGYGDDDNFMADNKFFKN